MGSIDRWLTRLHPDWHQRAACVGHPLDLWFPAQGRSGGPAKTICATCPVHPECLQSALDDPGLVGIWGGTTESERDRLRATRSSTP